MRKLVLLLLLIANVALADANSAPRSAKILPDPAAPDLKGLTRYPLGEARKAKKNGVVLFFLTTDCPIANRFVPEINRICHDFEKRNMAFYIVQTAPDLKIAQAQNHAKEYKLTCPVLLDRQHEIVKFCGASVTPECALLSSEGKILYRGRIDDRYAALGQFRAEPKERDLRSALEEFLEGKPIARARTKAIGCYIEG